MGDWKTPPNGGAFDTTTCNTEDGFGGAPSLFPKVVCGAWRLRLQRGGRDGDGDQGDEDNDDKNSSQNLFIKAYLVDQLSNRPDGQHISNNKDNQKNKINNTTNNNGHNTNHRNFVKISPMTPTLHDVSDNFFHAHYTSSKCNPQYSSESEETPEADEGDHVMPRWFGHKHQGTPHPTSAVSNVLRVETHNSIPSLSNKTKALSLIPSARTFKDPQLTTLNPLCGQRDSPRRAGEDLKSVRAGIVNHLMSRFECPPNGTKTAFKIRSEGHFFSQKRSESSWTKPRAIVRPLKTTTPPPTSPPIPQHTPPPTSPPIPQHTPPPTSPPTSSSNSPSTPLSSPGHHTKPPNTPFKLTVQPTPNETHSPKHSFISQKYCKKTSNMLTASSPPSSITTSSCKLFLKTLSSDKTLNIPPSNTSTILISTTTSPHTSPASTTLTPKTTPTTDAATSLPSPATSTRLSRIFKRRKKLVSNAAEIASSFRCNDFPNPSSTPTLNNPQISSTPKKKPIPTPPRTSSSSFETCTQGADGITRRFSMRRSESHVRDQVRGQVRSAVEGGLKKKGGKGDGKDGKRREKGEKEDNKRGCYRDQGHMACEEDLECTTMLYGGGSGGMHDGGRRMEEDVEVYVGGGVVEVVNSVICQTITEKGGAAGCGKRNDDEGDGRVYKIDRVLVARSTTIDMKCSEAREQIWKGLMHEVGRKKREGLNGGNSQSNSTVTNSDISGSDNKIKLNFRQKQCLLKRLEGLVGVESVA